MSLIQTDDFSTATIQALFDKAQNFLNTPTVPSLQDKLIITLFFENSTRTRSSFEIAAKRLGAQVVHLDVDKSSTQKGETLLDTVLNLDAMNPDAIIVRHAQNGIPKTIDEHVKAQVINAGDGNHAHPTQALLDLFTIQQHFGKEHIKGKRIAIVGDIKNSRVAHSNMELLARFGLDITLVAPSFFMPQTTFKNTDNLRSIIDDVDIIMSLRTQTERHSDVYTTPQEYAKEFCITQELLQKRNILILHPGPVHRNIDIEDGVLADARCKVLAQVTNGVAVRMAVLEHLIA